MTFAWLPFAEALFHFVCGKVVSIKMSVEDVLDQIEVQLSEETLKSLLEPDQLFKKDLTPQKPEASNSDKLKCPLASVILEKMAGNVVKIFVTGNFSKFIVLLC